MDFSKLNIAYQARFPFGFCMGGFVASFFVINYLWFIGLLAAVFALVIYVNWKEVGFDF